MTSSQEPPIIAQAPSWPAMLRAAAPGAIIALLVLVAYIPVWRAGFIWDDDSYVTSNPNLLDWDGLGRTWLDRNANPQYYPLTFATFWLEERLWGFNSLGYHLVNLALHISTALLLWRILRLLRLPGAWWAAAIFAVHPVHVESVAWITERKNALSGALYMVAALAYLRFAKVGGSDGASPSPTTQTRMSVPPYALALVAFAAALLAKSVTASLPLALALVLWWRGQFARRQILYLLPMLLLGAIAGLNTRDLEINHVGAKWAIPFLDRCLIAGRAVWFYAGKLLWPGHLTFNYPRWRIDAHAAWQYVWPSAALFAVPGLWLARKRIGRGPLVAALFLIVTLAPALGFSNTYPMRYSFVADHFQYLASIGLIALAAGGVGALARRSAGARIAAVVGGLAILGLLAVLTYRQARIYETPEKLWLDTLAKNPDSMLANDNFAVCLFMRGEYERALPYHRRALEIDSKDPRLYLNLAKTLTKLGQADAAVAQIQEAERVDRKYAPAYIALGDMRLAQNRLPEAYECFRQAVEVDPKNAMAHCDLGLALGSMNRPNDAKAEFLTALRLRPDLAEAHNNMGFIYEMEGRLDRAMASYSEAIRLKPDFEQARQNRNRVGEQLRRGK